MGVSGQNSRPRPKSLTNFIRKVVSITSHHEYDLSSKHLVVISTYCIDVNTIIIHSLS
jgi:hypothetical protein